MGNPFDSVIENIERRGYHNHRKENHSDIICKELFTDLLAKCESIQRDHASGIIQHWLNVRAHGGRERKIDLLVGEPLPNGNPDLKKMRICIENKSVIAAHRNAPSRYDDLNESLQVLYRSQPEAVLIATVLIGTCPRVLNVPDRIKPFFDEDDFIKNIQPRLSSGDEKLWVDFKRAISKNHKDDPKKTLDTFKKLNVRPFSRTDMMAYDYLLLVPVAIDNVNPPRLERKNTLGIDIDTEYEKMVKHIFKFYSARWHP